MGNGLNTIHPRRHAPLAKENRELFPVVTIIIMEAFINKMRRLKGVRKQLIVEEAWKALSSANMAEYLRYMYTTVRKYYGEAIVVTQEVDDIISSPVVKESIINNSDCKILLDQRKYMNKFDQIQALLGLTEKEKGQILSINMENNPSRLYKEVWIGLGGTQSAVYATEVSAEAAQEGLAPSQTIPPIVAIVSVIIPQISS